MARVILPLTPAQQPIWLGHQIDPASAVYSVASYVELAGTLDRPTLARAICLAVNEVDGLRARFFEAAEGSDGGPTQEILPEAIFRFPFLDLRGEPAPETAAREWMARDLAVRIDLTSGNIVSSSLLQLGDERFWWYFKSHHIALDGFSLSMVFRRVAECYSSLIVGAAVSPSPFGSLRSSIEAEEGYRASAAFEADRAYWRAKCTAMGEVPSFTREVALPTARAVIHEEAVSAELMRALQDSAGCLSTQWIQLLIAAFATFLARATGRRSVVVGLPLLNRLGTAAAKVPSTMANVLPLTVQIAPSEAVSDVVVKVARELSEMRLHQRYRAEDVRRDCNLVGESRRLTGPQINVDLFTEDLTFGGLSGRPRVLSAGPADDLSFMFQRGQDGAYRLVAMANPALYGLTELRLWAARFLAFLERVARDVRGPIGRLDALTGSEVDAIVERSRPVSPAKTSSETLSGVFEGHAARAPEAIALTRDGEQISYATLNAWANQLGHEMASRVRIAGNPRIALLLPRSVESIVAILAVLKTGAAYVPIDPDAPVERIQTILEDTAPVLVLTDEKGAAKLPDPRCPVLQLDAEETRRRLASCAGTNLSSSGRSPSPSDLAYVIYTSGSTGKPKGVKITHQNVVRLFRSTHCWFEYRSEDVWTLCHSYAFDASVWEIWGALLHGGRLVIVPVETTRAPEQLLELVAKEKVTIFGQIPSAFYRFMEAEQAHPELSAQLQLRYQCFGAEALDLNRLKPWLQRHEDDDPRLLNMYGITETTVNATHLFITAQQVASGSGSLIGKAYEDLGIVVLDDALRPVPVGSYGEMYVMGEGLAQGYLNRPDLDAVRFVANPFGQPGTRMYRSGDVGIPHEDGSLEYIGRADQQVKIRGYRIELGEIESHLRKHPGISDAVASVRVDAAGDPKLVAHVVPRTGPISGEAIDINALREYLRERLPAYMVPSAIGVLTELPFTRNGKVDRKALPEIQISGDRHVEPARDAVDEGVLRTWKGQLQADRFGIDDNFFDLGGDSIKAIRVCHELDMPVMVLFKAPTVRACADFLRAKGGPASLRETLLQRLGEDADGKINLVCVPYAGGTPMVYRLLAEQTQRAFSCTVVELPGHDPTHADGEWLGIGEVAERAAREIAAELRGPIVVYGHCAGNAIAVELSRRLEEAGANLVALVIGGMLLDARPNDVLERVSQQTGQELLAFLRSIGGFKDVLDEATLARIAGMTKHDSQETAAFFAVEEGEPKRLKAPIHVVVGDQDPLTQGFAERHLDWRRYSDQVSLSVIEGGGHYFLGDHAADLAEILVRKFAAAAPGKMGGGVRNLREFVNPFDEDDGSFFLLQNDSGQSSLWPAFAELPAGWRVCFGPGPRDACLERVPGAPVPPARVGGQR